MERNDFEMKEPGEDRVIALTRQIAQQVKNGADSYVHAREQINSQGFFGAIRKKIDNLKHTQLSAAKELQASAVTVLSDGKLTRETAIKYLSDLLQKVASLKAGDLTSAFSKKDTTDQNIYSKMAEIKLILEGKEPKHINKDSIQAQLVERSMFMNFRNEDTFANFFQARQPKPPSPK